MRKTIVFLGAPFELYKGGSEHQYRQLETILSPQFDVFYLFRHDRVLSNPRFITYGYKRPRVYNRYNYSDAAEIYRLLESISPDIVYKRGGNYILSTGVLYARRHKKRSIWHIASEMDVLPYKFRLGSHCLNKYVDRKILKFGVAHADTIVGQTHYQSELLKAAFNRSCDFVVPNLHPVPSEALVKNKSTVQIIWIGNIKPVKRPALFLDLVEALRQEHCKFIMVGRPGTGILQATIETRLTKLSNVQFLGELPNSAVNTLLGQSHILVNTSEHEGFPNTFIEAWLRKVVPVSLCVDPDHILTTKEIGRVSGTMETLATDLKQLIRDEMLRHRIAAEGYQHAINNHTVDRNVDKIQEIFAA